MSTTDWIVVACVWFLPCLLIGIRRLQLAKRKEQNEEMRSSAIAYGAREFANLPGRLTSDDIVRRASERRRWR